MHREARGGTCRRWVQRAGATLVAERRTRRSGATGDVRRSAGRYWVGWASRPPPLVRESLLAPTEGPLVRESLLAPTAPGIPSRYLPQDRNPGDPPCERGFSHEHRYAAPRRIGRRPAGWYVRARGRFAFWPEGPGTPGVETETQPCRSVRQTRPRRSRRPAGYVVGSGLMEATCRQVVGQRLKGSGRQWREAGSVALATLIAYRMNGDWDVFWATASLARAG